MLTTAVGLLSSGTEPANSHPVASGQNEPEDGSFAYALEQGGVLAGRSQPKVVDDRVSQHTGDDESPAAAQSPHSPATFTTSAENKGGSHRQGELKNALPAVDIKNQDTKTSASEVSGAKDVAPQGAQQSQKSASNTHATSIADLMPESPPAVPDSQLAAGSGQAAGQKNPDTKIGNPQTDLGDGTAAPSTSAPSTADLLLPGHGRKQLPPDQNKLEMIAPCKSAKVAATQQRDVSKTGKPSRTEKKEDKVAAKSEATAVGIEAQIQLMTSVVGIATQVAVPPGKPNEIVQGRVSPPSTSVSTISTGQSGRLITAASYNKKTGAGTAGTDAANGKGVADAVPNAKPGDAASLKLATDAAKDATHPLVSAAATGAKEQGDVAAVTASATPHAEGASAVAIAGVTSGAVSAHVLPPQTHSFVPASSAGSTASGTSAGSGVVSGQADAAPSTLSASPTALEVGVSNGTHGWLKIRAEMTSGGVVDASLSTSSSSGQEMLHRELPSLTTYLQNEHVAINTVVVQPMSAVRADLGGFQGGLNGDGHGPAQQSSSQGGDNRQQAASTALNDMENRRSYVSAPPTGGDDLLSPTSYAGGGSWLSVRA